MVSLSASEKRNLVNSKEKKEPIIWSLTFSIEKLRFFALFAITLLFGTGAALKECIFTDIDEWYPKPEDSGRDLLRGTKDAVVSQISETLGLKDRNLGLLDFNLFGHPFCEPYVKMKETYIWTTFGFPHTCSFIDYNPFAEIFAILIPLFTLPMIGFLLGSHLRAKMSVANGEAKPYLYTYHKFTTPFNVAVVSWCHLWFVNKPDAVFPDGYGFLAHYIPYYLFQWTLALVAIGQVHYYIARDLMPFGVPFWVGKWYARIFVAMTIAYQLIVITILAGTPILDSAKGGLEGTWERSLFVSLTEAYKYMGLIFPLILSFSEIYNGDTNTITFSHL